MRIKKGFVLREVAGSFMVIATGEASREFNGMIRLNQTGCDIWKGISDGLSEKEIADKLAETYDVTPEKALEDTRKILAKMEEAGFLMP